MNETFDLERAVREGCKTRDEHKVRILCTDRKDPYPVWGLVSEFRPDGSVWERPEGWTKEGKYRSSTSAPDSRDLLNLPQTTQLTVRRWLVVGILEDACMSRFFTGYDEAVSAAHCCGETNLVEVLITVEMDKQSKAVLRVVDKTCNIIAV